MARADVVLTADQARRARLAVARHCATAPDETALLGGIAARIRPIVDYDAAAWLTADPESMDFTDAVIEGFDSAICHPWFENELLADDVHKFVDLAGGRRPATWSSARPDAATSARWNDLMRPVGLDAELRAAFADGTGCWGAVELHREVGRPAFTPDEAALLGDVGADVAAGLRRLAIERSTMHVDGTDGPGLFYVHPDGTVTAATEAGSSWLALLVAGPGAHEPTALSALGALARGGVDRPRRTRVRAADGRWVTLHASPATNGMGTAVIVEPARPADVAAVLTLAYGLSDRERDVALAVARGDTTEQIAEALFISVHTVRDHLKSGFAKVGASSRTELVARLFHDPVAERSRTT